MASGAFAGAEFSLGFGVFESSSTHGAEIAQNQLSITVAQYGNSVRFIFSNYGSTSSSLTEIYFERPSDALGVMTMGPTGRDTEFVEGVDTRSQLPGSQEIGFEGVQVLVAAGNDNSNGVNPGESVSFGYALNGSWDDFVDDLESGEFRIGIRVQDISALGDDASMVNCRGDDCDPKMDPTQSIPLPSAAGLGLLGLGVVASRRRR